jgi:hypothetical protein
MCAGSKADPGEGDQGGRAKGSQNWVYGDLNFCHRLGSTIFPLCRPPFHHRGCERQRVLRLTHCVSKSVRPCHAAVLLFGTDERTATEGASSSSDTYSATRALTARAGQPASMMVHQSAKFSASHATLDPDRACSAAQDGTLSLSKAAIRLTQMIVP